MSEGCSAAVGVSQRRSSHLYEHGEYDNSDGSRDEQVPSVEVFGQREDQSEADGAPHASVGEAKLVLECELDGAEGVDDLG